MGSVIKISKINTEGGTQPRTKLDEGVVDEYAHALTEGAALPPVVLFHDGADYWLADGFHRFHAHRKIGAYDIEADIRQGTRRDAILYSVGANSSHGLRRSNEDKRKAVSTLLEDTEWAKWSDNQIAKACGVAHSFVGRIRSSLVSESSETPAERTYTTKAGTTATMKTANIGKKLPHAPKRTIEQEPEEEITQDDEALESRNTIIELAAENERLNDRLAVEVMDASEEEKTAAMETINELRARIHILEVENDALRVSRDTYMRESAEKQKQINYWRRAAEKKVAA